MSNQTKPATIHPARQYRQLVTTIATSLLADWVGAERAKEAAGRISAALSASAASARNPNDFYQCTTDSIGRCVAIAALTDIMPGTGSTALAYLIPRRPRKGEPPQLQYQLSHRGLNALARRTGQTMIAVPISHRDELTFSEDGDIRIVNRDIDNPPTSEDDLRGVLVLVRETRTGKTIVRGWVPVSLINVRREGSDSYRYALKNAYAKNSDPWHQWYVEMAMKTAMHYAISRGWCVIDDAGAIRAVSIDQSQDYAQLAPPVDRIPQSDSRTDQLADMLSDKHAQDLSDSLGEILPGDDAGEESQEPAEAEDETQDNPPVELGNDAMVFVDRLNNATTKKEMESIFGEANQSKLAKKLTDAEFVEIRREYEACKNPKAKK